MQSDSLLKYTYKLSGAENGLPDAPTVMALLGVTERLQWGMCFLKYFNQEKARLDEVPSRDYNMVRSISDPFETLIPHLRKRMNISCCSRGWVKMWEMMTTHQLLSFTRQTFDDIPIGEGSTVTGLFNCELPGGFLLATSHYARKQGIKLEWWASSLFPSASTSALEDTYGLFQRCPDRWLMSGKLGSNGDMTDPRAVRHLCEELAKKSHKVNLYTADGGMDIGSQYADQEYMHQGLVLGEMIVCLACLAKGGNAVIKMYSFTTDFMQSVILAAACHFEYAFLSKPLTSRPVNSEIYLVLKNFAGVQQTLITVMQARLEDVQKSALAFESANPLMDMGAPAVAGFTSRCIHAMDRLGRMQNLNISELVRRASTIADKSSWKNNKLGPMSKEDWLAVMAIQELEANKEEDILGIC